MGTLTVAMTMLREVRSSNLNAPKYPVLALNQAPRSSVHPLHRD